MPAFPAVTVCIPTYNGAIHLPECLDSVCVQTCGDIEILVVDDCSTDGTFEIASEYAKRDNRFRVVRNDSNLGLVGNWEKCVRLANTEYVKFAFQDDVLYPRCTEALVDAIQRGVRFAFCAREFIAEDEANSARMPGLDRGLRKINAFFAKDRAIQPPAFVAAVLQTMPLNIVGEPTVTLVHRQVFKDYGPFNPNFLQLMDFEFWCRIGVNEPLCYVPEVLAKFRLHGQSETSRNISRRLYQAEVIDRLLLLHEFAFNPVFARFRELALAGRPAVDVLDTFYEQAHWVREFAADKNDRSEAEALQAAGWRYPVLLTPPPLKYAMTRKWRSLQRLMRSMLPAFN